MIRKISLLFFFVFTALSLYCQDTLYYDKRDYITRFPARAKYYDVIYRDSLSPEKVTVKSYYSPYMMKEEKHYSDFDKKILDGKYRRYYETGNLYMDINYKEGQFEDTVKTYWGNGKLKRLDIYRNGEFVSGTCYNSHGLKLDYYDYFIPAKFRDGEKKEKSFLKKNLKLPEGNLNNVSEPKVILKLHINQKGLISSYEILQSSGDQYTAEVKKLFPKMPRWQPAMVDGMPVASDVDWTVLFPNEIQKDNR